MSASATQGGHNQWVRTAQSEILASTMPTRFHGVSFEGLWVLFCTGNKLRWWNVANSMLKTKAPSQLSMLLC